MGKKTIIFGASAVLWFAVLWQGILKDVVFIFLGLGRTYQKIEEFPYSCKRIRSPLLESCEDMWLDEEGRNLYAACSTIANRQGWGPGADAFNVSARDLNDHVSVLNIDDPGSNGMYGLHRLEITGSYRSATKGKDIDLNGFNAEVLSNSRLRFWMANNRPAVDEAGNFLDATKVGANCTIEVFERTRGSNHLEFITTIHSETLPSPNNIAATGHDSIFVTNDHTNRVGTFRFLQALLGDGTIAHCHLNGTCATALSLDLKYPNGVVKPTSPDNILYIANTAKGFISFHTTSASRLLSPIHLRISIGMPIDNLSLDSEGDVYVAGFPKIWQVLGAMGSPGKESNVASSVFRVRRVLVRDEEFEEFEKQHGVEGNRGRVEHVVEKLLEDVEGKVLPAASTVVHDVKTGNLWLSGFASRFITVCEPRPVAD